MRVKPGRVQIPGEGMFSKLTFKKAKAEFGPVRGQSCLRLPLMENSRSSMQRVNRVTQWPTSEPGHVLGGPISGSVREDTFITCSASRSLLSSSLFS